MVSDTHGSGDMKYICLHATIAEALTKSGPGLRRFYCANFYQILSGPQALYIDVLEYTANAWKMSLTDELVMVGDYPANDNVFDKNAKEGTMETILMK